jgi:2-dehydropantoate 2-reductase
MMGFERIIVLGAGAIGSAIGAFLSKKEKITLIGRRAHVDAINARGLLLSGDGEGRYQIESSTEVQQIPRQTLIIVTTKAQNLHGSLTQIRNLIREDSVILLLQNGIGNEEIANQAVGSGTTILRGVTEMAAEFFEPGEIRYWPGDTFIGSGVASGEIAAILNACGLSTYVDVDIRNRVWSKAVVNCVVNPLSAIFRVRNNEVVSDWLKPIRHQIVTECMRVGAAEVISFPENFVERIDAEIGKYANFSSMCQDVMRHRKTEIDFLNGKFTELARRDRIPTPTNDTMVRFIRFVEDKNEHRKD